MKKFLKNLYILRNTKHNVNIECSFEWNSGFSEDVQPFATVQKMEVLEILTSK